MFHIKPIKPLTPSSCLIDRQFIAIEKVHPTLTGGDGSDKLTGSGTLLLPDMETLALNRYGYGDKSASFYIF